MLIHVRTGKWTYLVLFLNMASQSYQRALVNFIFLLFSSFQSTKFASFHISLAMTNKRPDLRLPFTSLVVDWRTFSWKCVLSQCYSYFHFHFIFLNNVETYFHVTMHILVFDEYLCVLEAFFFLLEVWGLSKLFACNVISCTTFAYPVKILCRLVLQPKNNWWNA